MKTLKLAIRLLTGAELKSGSLLLILVIGMAILDTTGVASVMPFLAVLASPEMIETNPWLREAYATAEVLGIREPEGFFVALGIFTFVFMVSAAIFRTTTHFLMNRYVEKCRHSLSTRLLESFLSQPYTFFLRRHSSDISKTILAEVDQVVSHVLRPALNMFAYIFLLLFLVGLLVAVNFKIAILSAGGLIVMYFLFYQVVKHKLKGLGAQRAAANKGRFITTAEALGGIKEIKVNGVERSYIDRFSVSSIALARTVSLNTTLGQLPGFLVEAILFGGMIILTIYMLLATGGLNSAALGEILPLLGLYAFAAYRMKPAVHSIYQGVTSLRYGMVALEGVSKDLHAAGEWAHPRNGLLQKISFQSSLRLQNISFTYPGSEVPALRAVNLEIVKGDSVGLVGSTGSGKTTLVDFILGLLAPDEGQLFVDGMALEESLQRAWRRSIGYVSQVVFLADKSITENIALGQLIADVDMERVKSCAAIAQLTDLIEQTLPDGYETVVGERGVRMSGGERQRIGLARALYSDPEILVLDEATSALDTITERKIVEALANLAPKKTLIVIAHRLTTIKNCTSVVMMENGEITAQGKFDELVDSSGVFREMAGR